MADIQEVEDDNKYFNVIAKKDNFVGDPTFKLTLKDFIVNKRPSYEQPSYDFPYKDDGNTGFTDNELLKFYYITPREQWAYALSKMNHIYQHISKNNIQQGAKKSQFKTQRQTLTPKTKYATYDDIAEIKKQLIVMKELEAINTRIAELQYGAWKPKSWNKDKEDKALRWNEMVRLKKRRKTTEHDKIRQLIEIDERNQNIDWQGAHSYN